MRGAHLPACMRYSDVHTVCACICPDMYVASRARMPSITATTCEGVCGVGRKYAVHSRGRARAPADPFHDNVCSSPNYLRVRALTRAIGALSACKCSSTVMSRTDDVPTSIFGCPISIAVIAAKGL